MQLPVLLTAVTAISVAFASPIQKRQVACSSNGQWVCTGQALQQCTYGAGGVLVLTTIQNCGAGTYCTVGGFVGCAVGTPPSTTVGGVTSTVAPSTTVQVPTTSTTTTITTAVVTGNLPACYPAWVSTTPYSGGAKVSYNNVNYVASWWEQGTSPDQKGDGGWASQGPCGTGPASSTTTTTTVPIKSSTTTTTTSAAISTTAPTSVFTSSTTTTTTAKSTTTSVPGNYSNLIVGYWGAHPSAGELTLRAYCDLRAYDIIHLSFIDALAPVARFSSDITARPAPQTMASLAADILHCQSLGIRIGAAVGGAIGSIGLGTGKGKPIANDLWNNFMGGSTPLANRVLPGVVLDGIDLDVESSDGSTNAGYAELANELRSLIVASGKPFFISAAPQCPIPDANMDYTLKNGWFDFVSVQFYSAPCGLGFSGSPNGPNYADNSSIWNHGQGSWMTQASLWPNKNVKLMVGFPASASAGNYGGGDVMSLVKQYVPGWKALNPNVFGGLMWWDCYWSYIAGPGVAASFKSYLNSLP
ncbi:UNVERIFIED_CONTAM: Chitinase 1 [Siphonaria sp. JEL0065]|nr:Chitinase 1 [Siphonaria sp. JEL0065]